MSGLLVGEVIAAVSELKSRGISKSGYLALLAIAEKCPHGTREASVPLSWIQTAMYEVSESTARRAIRTLTATELVEVARRGFRNRHVSRAPIYRLLALPTAMAAARKLDDGTAMTAASGSSSGQNGSSSGHFSSSSVIDPPLNCDDATLNGCINGSFNGGQLGHPAPPPTPAPGIPEEQPARYCPRHMPDGTAERCRDCGTQRERHQRWSVEEAERRRQAKEAIEAAITACHLCDEAGWLLGDDGSVDDRNIRCTHKPTTEYRTATTKEKATK